MSHNITDRDGVFTVRTPAWHGLGHVFPDHPTREEAKAVGHNWEPTTEPLYRVIKTEEHFDSLMCQAETRDECDDSTHWKTKSKAVRVPEFDLVVRDDTSEPLGVKPDTRTLVTNEEMYDVAEALQGEGSEVRYETGGSLKGGRKVWLLLRLNEPLVIGGRHGTETIPYYALQNANDGSGSFRGQATMVTIVCDNTSQMADLDAGQRGTEFVFAHTSGIKDRIEEAKTALMGWRDSVTAYQAIADHLIDVRVTPEQRQLFVREFIPMPQENLISDRVRANVVQARIKMSGIFESATQETVKDTAFGLVQGSLEYVQWYRKARSEESRFQRSYLERSRLTTQARDLALEVSRA